MSAVERALVTTAETIEEILAASGPWRSEKAREAHRRWLEGLGQVRLQARLDELRATSQRPNGQRLLPSLGLRYARGT